MHKVSVIARRAGLTLLFFVFWELAGMVLPSSAAPPVPEQPDAALRTKLLEFSRVLDVVASNYAEPLDYDKAIYNGAIPGMLHVLDPHSNFFDPKSYGALREEQHGSYAGVGMSIAPRNNRIIVLAPFTGTPAYRAGIRPGDVIVAVDDKRTDNMSAGDVADLLKGPKGTMVRVSILRGDSDKPSIFTLVRAEIPRNSVDLCFQVRPGVGYLHISSFNETTEHEVEDCLHSLGDAQALLLDLRGNPGGLVNEGVGVADKFLRKGKVIVSYHGRSSPERVFKADYGNGDREYPLVVLINRGTASAAEIVSGALQDHDRALIAGERSFGKGLVQTVYPISANTGLALTTAKYYTPSGRLIQRDYTGVSLYDYYYEREPANAHSGPPKRTEHGRIVYGGGGIMPDVAIAPMKTNHFEDLLLEKYAFFNFAADYTRTHTVQKNSEVDANVMDAFRQFLRAQKIAFQEKDLNDDWVRAQIKTELFISQFGQQEGLMVRAQSDPQIRAALGLLPQAKALLSLSADGHGTH